MTTNMRKLIMITEGKSTGKRDQMRNLCERVAHERKQLVEGEYGTSTGKYSTEYDELYANLVPTSGKSDTLQGEIIRAASKIYSDYRNNGFGNNWAPVLKFLANHGLPDTFFNYLATFAAGGTSVSDYYGHGKNDELMERMVDWAIETARDTDPNAPTDDMWSTHVSNGEFPDLADENQKELEAEYEAEEDERTRWEDDDDREYDTSDIWRK